MSEATIATAERPVRITQNSAISVGLLVIVAAAAIAYGRQWQQLETVSADMKTLRSEVGEIRTLLLTQQTRDRAR